MAQVLVEGTNVVTIAGFHADVNNTSAGPWMPGAAVPGIAFGMRIGADSLWLCVAVALCGCGSVWLWLCVACYACVAGCVSDADTSRPHQTTARSFERMGAGLRLTLSAPSIRPGAQAVGGIMTRRRIST